MVSSPITHIRYVAHAIPQFEETLAFYTGPFGLPLVHAEDDITYLTSEGSEEAFELRLRRADQKSLEIVGFAATNSAAVDRLAAELKEAGVRIDREPSQLKTPGGGYGFRFFDVDGRLIEVSSDVEHRGARELREGETIPLKLSHVVLNSPDPVKTREFYMQHLGFGLRETLLDFLHFLYTGKEHHFLAFSKSSHVAFHHVAFEMRGLNEFLLANGRLVRSGIKPVMGPGRHGQGDNTFDYLVDPAGNVAEYTFGLMQIEDPADYPFRVSGITPEEVDQWGLVGPFEEYGAASQGVPDPKLWTSSPV
jgi:catechol 2,3-dioxygenase-like lactoylglutathione lyase family enzyme